MQLKTLLFVLIHPSLKFQQKIENSTPAKTKKERDCRRPSVKQSHLCKGTADQLRGKAVEENLSAIFFFHSLVELLEGIPGGSNADHS